ncbi:sulfatase-like hydrolase/transferase [Phenylobacterium sp.]|uniref:sulfatase family protein n=1 Tax=Phenylobacterium sp. TaxID=1871053 RepID=UPI00289FAB5D|nr:sulfatase-like hydrolase/transferase [Phenylobacterium sp.]
MAAITRRSAVAAVAATAAAGTAQAKAPPGLPNILWLVSEDNNPLIGAYGDPLAHTPTIDALAATGVLYRNAYSNAPVCAPSRFGILTGVYPESCAPAEHMRARAALPSQVKTYPELLRAAGYHCINNAKTDYNSDVDPARIWDESGTKAHWRSRPAGKPFMAVFNYETTHESRLFLAPPPGRVRPDQVRVPAYLPDTPGVRGDIANYYNLIEKMDGQLAERLAELEADGLADDTIVFYYSDNGGSLPRSKRYCYDEGLRCALVVRLPPKWAHLCPHKPGTQVQAPVSFIDLAPTLLSLAGLPAASHMQGAAFLGTRARPAKTYAFGMRGRMDERYDFVRTVTDGRWRYIRNYMPHRPWGMHGAFEWLAKGYQDWESAWRAGTLNADQRRFFETKPYEELYDLASDRDQVRNLIDDPAAQQALGALRTALDRHMLAVVDNGFIPEGAALEGYEASRSGAYALPRIMALAEAAAKGRPANLAALQAALGDPYAVARYWATTGLLILGSHAAPAKAALRKAMTDDASPQVRVVAAETVAGLGDVDDALAVLTDLADGDQPWQVKLQALNALTALGEAARPALPTFERAAAGQQEYLRNAGRYMSAVLKGEYTPAYPVFPMPGRT